MKLLHLSWEDVQRLSEKLAEKVRRSGFRPELIVAIGRGGFVPARILCDLLEVKELASMEVEYYKDIEERGEEPRVIHPLNADVEDRYVLVVDDVSDSGRSLQLAVNQILQKRPKVLRVATLHYKPWSACQPDFFAEETEAWVIYPWEVFESARSFFRKLRREGLSCSEVRERLLALNFREEDIEALLKEDDTRN
ncbi:MAG: phosphoribosyltransferase [Candidatus Bathyarchaeia archaeon]